MFVMTGSARQAGLFADEQQGGHDTEEERRSAHPRTGHSSSWDRMRDQQIARSYWRREYGEQAERASRGGVTWL